MAGARGDGAQVMSPLVRDRMMQGLGDIATLRFQKLLPVDERGRLLPPFRAMGRGASLHLATEEALYRVDLMSL